MTVRLLLVALLLAVGCSSDQWRTSKDPTSIAAAMHTLVDDFAGTSVQAGLWNYYKDPGRAAVEDQLVVTLTPDVAGYGGLISASPYSLAGSLLMAEISQVAEGGRDTETFIGASTLDEEEYVVLPSLDGKIGAYYKWRGERWRELSQIEFDPVQHRFRRIREQNGTIYYELSANGTDWLLPAGWQVDHRFTDIHALHVVVGAGAYVADPAPGVALIEGVNTAASLGEWPRMESSVSDPRSDRPASDPSAN